MPDATPDSAAADPFETPLASPLGGFNEALGLIFETVSADEVVLRLPIGPHLHQPYGIVHGGVWCAAVETAASVGAGMWFGDRGNVVGVANQTDFLRAVRDGEVRIRATPIHRGRLQQVWMVELHDDTERLVARGQVRIQNLESADGLGRS